MPDLLVFSASCPQVWADWANLKTNARGMKIMNREGKGQSTSIVFSEM